MGLESATYISDLVSTNPVGSDAKSAGDDHIRLIKAAVKATFPNVAGAVTPTHTELNYVDGVTSAIQTQLDAKQSVDADLTAISALSGTGILARTGAGTYSERTITAGSGVSVQYGDGVSGNPTISVTPGVGLGDVVGPSSSVDSEIPLFDGTGGKTLKRASLTGVLKATSGVLSAATANTDYLVSDLNGADLLEVGTTTFDTAYTISSTSGSITLDWNNAQHQKQTEPTGAITYTFTAPPGPARLQLIIDSDGTSTAQTITWPGSVVWLGETWAGANNKKSLITFWYDGTSYFAMGANQV